MNISLSEEKPGNFPVTLQFHDIKDEEDKKIVITEEAWEEAENTFKNNQDQINPLVIIKYISKHEETNTEQSVFK